jgi:hypothetical protein
MRVPQWSVQLTDLPVSWLILRPAATVRKQARRNASHFGGVIQCFAALRTKMGAMKGFIHQVPNKDF